MLAHAVAVANYIIEAYEVSISDSNVWTVIAG